MRLLRALVVLALGSPAAYANSLLLSGTGGGISYEGVGSPVVGAGLTLDSILFYRDSDGTFGWDRPLVGGGADLVTGSSSKPGGNNFIVFTPGGSFAVHGSFDGLPSETFFVGSFDGPTSIRLQTDGSYAFVATGTGRYSPTALASFVLVDQEYQFSVLIGFHTSAVRDGFTATSTYTNPVLGALTVPEPTSALLLALGLAGAFVLRRAA